MIQFLSILCLVIGWQVAVAQTVTEPVTDEYIHQKRGKVALIQRHQNGQISQTGWYQANIPDGAWACFNENGQLTTQARYEEGLKHGTWKFWDSQGNLLYEIEYHYGTLISARQYNVSGAVIASK